jgi:6-bladed beta-propeller
MGGRKLLSFSAVCGLVIGGCADGSAPGPQPFTVDTLTSGRIVIENDGTGVWDETTAWTLEETMRLGTVDAGGPEQFSEIYWIDEDDQGRVYILDNQAQEIRVFDVDGTYSHTIGRRGEGPGEFTRAAGMNWAPDGRLWVYDTQRFSVFEREGAFVDSWPRQTRGVIFPWYGGFVPDRQFIDWGLDRERSADRPNETTGLTTLYPIEFTPPDAYDTLPPIEFQAFMAGPGRMASGMNKGVMLAQMNDGYIWFTHTDEYRLMKRTMDGDTLVVATHPSVPSEIPLSEIDSLISFYKEMGSPRDYDPADFVRERRLITRLITDQAGHLYVFPQEDGVPEGTALDVFEDTGVYLGRITLPEKVNILSPRPTVTRNNFYAVVLDEFDVPFVVRWRIVRPVAEP